MSRQSKLDRIIIDLEGLEEDVRDSTIEGVIRILKGVELYEDYK